MNSNNIPPLIASALFMSIPLVAILLRHQRQMAELMRKPPEQGDALHSELSDLRRLIHDQTIAIDRLSARVDQMKALPERLNSEERI